MKRVRIGLVGCGRVSQAAHLPFLAAARDRFELVAVADPSDVLRETVAARYGVAERHRTLDDLLSLGLEAVLVAAPVPVHAELVTKALDHGLHVLCEKPLAFTLRECDELIAARDRSGRVAQVGYMKRFDPAYRRLLELLPRRVEELRYAVVEVNDAHERPFATHLDLVAGSASEEWRAEVLEREREQIREAFGELGPEAYRAFRHGLAGSLIHDVNLAHGILERLGQPLPARVADGAFFAGGAGVTLAWELEGGGRLSGTHLELRGVAEYRERLTLYCEDRILELVFASPYLHHVPTRLVERRTAGETELETIDHRVSYASPFALQLEAFYDSVVTGAPVTNTLEEARLDVEAIQLAQERAVLAAAPA